MILKCALFDRVDLGMHDTLSSNSVAFHQLSESLGDRELIPVFSENSCEDSWKKQSDSIGEGLSELVAIIAFAG